MIIEREFKHSRDEVTGRPINIPTGKLIIREEMKEKTVQITVPEGYEVDKEKSSFEKIVFRALRDELPKTWKQLRTINGYWTDSDARILGGETDGITTVFDANKGVWPTREEAEASIALAMLCQLRDRYNGGWKPDWTDEETEKYFILLIEGEPRKDFSYRISHPLSFKTAELRDEFMKNFADLIETAKPLLG